MCFIYLNLSGSFYGDLSIWYNSYEQLEVNNNMIYFWTMVFWLKKKLQVYYNPMQQEKV